MNFFPFLFPSNFVCVYYVITKYEYSKICLLHSVGRSCHVDRFSSIFIYLPCIYAIHSDVYTNDERTRVFHNISLFSVLIFLSIYFSLLIECVLLYLTQNLNKKQRKTNFIILDQKNSKLFCWRKRNTSYPQMVA